MLTVTINRTYSSEHGTVAETTCPFPKATRDMWLPRQRKRGEKARARRALKKVARLYGVPLKSYIRNFAPVKK